MVCENSINRFLKAGKTTLFIEGFDRTVYSRWMILGASDFGGNVAVGKKIYMSAYEGVN